MEKDGPEIKLYAVSTCSHCRALMEFLEENNFPFDCVYVDELLGSERRDVIKEVKRVNKRCSFPTTLIDEKVVVGFRLEELKEALRID